MKVLLKYLKPYLQWLALAIILLFIQAMCELTLPDYMSKIINEGILQKNTPFIIRIGGAMLAISLGSVIAAILVGLIAARIAAGVAQYLRKDMFKKVSGFSNTELDKFSTASLITRTTNDITQIQSVLVTMIRMVFYAPIMGMGGIVRALSKDVSMSWIIALAVGLLFVLIGLIMYLTIPKFKMIQKIIDKLNLVVRENLTGMLVIRAFHTEKFEEKRFDETNHNLSKVQLFANRMMSVMMPAMMLLMNLTSVLVIWVGAGQIEKARLQVGDMIAFMQYAMQIIMSFLMISMMFILIPRAAVSGKRIVEVLITANSIEDPAEPKKLTHSRGVVAFNHVNFHYPSSTEEILHDINFVAKPGQTTAFIGATGSGKTTLINLIPRFYEVTSGEVLIDGINVKDFTGYDLRELIGYVPQKAILFSGTIESNLKFGSEEAAEEELMAVSGIAQASDFILARPDKLQTDIAQGGGNVSGGQKQRLAIARALAKKSPIYIFDDSFSALDFKTDRKLREALKEYTTKSTVLLVGQRISSIMHAEQIIVLDEGHIVGKGTHEELMKDCKVYQEIALSQLSKEELES